MKNVDHLKITNAQYGPGESVSLSLSYFDLRFDLITYYRPPSEHQLDDLESLIESTTQAHTILVGDLNLPDIDWTSNNGVAKESQRKGFHRKALSLIQRNAMRQLIREPTHVKGNTLDLVLVEENMFEYVDIVTSVEPRISDHNLISLTITTDTNDMTEGPSKKRFNFNRAKYEEIGPMFENVKEQMTGKNANAMWSMGKNTVHEALDKHVPKLLDKPKGQPWMTRSIKRLMRQSCNVYRSNKTSKNPDFELQKLLENTVKKEICSAKKQFIDTHLTEELTNGNTKPLFRYINKHKGESNQISSLDTAETDTIPNVLADFFASVFTPEDDIPENTTPSTNKRKIKVSKNGIISLIKSLDARKTSGPDHIGPYTIKSLVANVSAFVDCIKMIYEKSLEEGNVPDDWKKAVVVPVFKSGSRSNPGNYRPISLTCILGKLLEHIIASQMWDFIDEEDLITSRQHGFRKRLSTTTQLLHVVHNAAKSTNEKQHYNMISFDFKKAFDKGCHKLLINKLHGYSFPVQIVLWIEEWLRARSSVVAVNSSVSRNFQVTSGVPQGSVLGPLLFLIYVDDITREIKSDIRLYADDTLLCHNIENDNDAAIFQSDILKLSAWAKKWKMVFNVSKCAHLEIGSPKPRYHFCLDGQIIPTAESIKYLGVTIDYKLKFQEHIDDIIGKGNKLLGMIRRCLGPANQHTKMVAFNSIVRPTVEYACQVWSPEAQKRIHAVDSVQRRAVRWVYHLQRMDSVSEAMEEHHIISLFDRREQLDTKLINKIQLGDYDIDLKDYIIFNEQHNTRGSTINPHFTSNIFKHVFFNRMRPQVKIVF